MAPHAHTIYIYIECGSKEKPRAIWSEIGGISVFCFQRVCALWHCFDEGKCRNLRGYFPQSCRGSVESSFFWYWG